MNLVQELAAKYRAEFNEPCPLSPSRIRELWLEEKVACGLSLKTKNNCGPVKPLAVQRMRREILSNHAAAQPRNDTESAT